MYARWRPHTHTHRGIVSLKFPVHHEQDESFVTFSFFEGAKQSCSQSLLHTNNSTVVHLYIQFLVQIARDHILGHRRFIMGRDAECDSAICRILLPLGVAIPGDVPIDVDYAIHAAA